MLLLKNGTLIDPYTDTEEKTDILIGDDGIISEIAPDIHADCETVDLSGKAVSPGLVDVHVHFRDPGQTHKEDILTGSAAAAAGGFTTVVLMANTVPAVDSIETLNYVQEKAKNVPINVLQAAAITEGRAGKKLVDFEALKKAGAPGFTDDGTNLDDPKLCYEAMCRAKDLDVPLSFHEEDPAFILSPGVNYGSAASVKFGVKGAMPSSEECMVARDIALAMRTGARVAFQHISSGKSVALIRAGKALGADVHAEVTPHHLMLTEEDVLEYGTYARMNPPLRTEQDRQALIEGVKDGTLDMIATDHAPHAREEKDKDFAHAPSGITGIETSFSVCNTALVQTGRLTKLELLRAMSQNPAEFYKLTGKSVEVGNRAELMIADWDAKVVFTEYKSKSDNTPFTGRELTGKVCAIVMGDSYLEQ